MNPDFILIIKEDIWVADLNQFIQDDEEDAIRFNVRIAVEELLQVCILSNQLDTC